LSAVNARRLFVYSGLLALLITGTAFARRYQFDAVVCQFGIMFVPDKAHAAREAYRVLNRDGIFLFNVWDAMRDNKLGELAH